MKEEQRRRIAREYLEKNFGKYGVRFYFFNDVTLPISKPPFELWKCYESMEPGSWESRAFRVIDAPYITNSNKPVIIVSDNQEELFEIAKIVISEERWETGSPEFDRFKNYYVMFD